MIMTAKQLKKIRKRLPNKYAEELVKRTGKNISQSLVMAVMNNLRKDYYGIIDAAIRWGNEIERSKKKQLEKAGVL